MVDKLYYIMNMLHNVSQSCVTWDFLVKTCVVSCLNSLINNDSVYTYFIVGCLERYLVNIWIFFTMFSGMLREILDVVLSFCFLQVSTLDLPINFFILTQLEFWKNRRNLVHLWHFLYLQSSLSTTFYKTLLIRNLAY